MAPTGNEYKKILKEIADNLTFSDVGSLKFVCRGQIGAAALGKVPNGEPLKLFKLLEERLLISQENLTWLRCILKQIQRIDLVGKIPDEFCKQSSVDVVDSADVVSAASPLSGSMVASDVVSPYRVLLKAVADELTSDSISEMKFLLDVPDGIGEKLQDGQSLLTHLEGIGKLSERNFNDLKDLLNDVHRKDLIKKIEEFSINEAQPPLPPISPSRDPASCYLMQRPHGFALIINIRTFEGATDEGFVLNERRGSEVDLINLNGLWEDLGFIVEKHENLKAHQICTVVDNMAKKINKNQGSSCFVCCIMTHGAMGKIYGSDSNFVNIKHVTDSFKVAKCPALEGKPKLFFIQACRGRLKLTGRTLPGSTGSSNTATPATGVTPTTTYSTNTTMPETQQTQGLDADAFPVEATAATDEDQYDDINNTAFRRNADPNEPHFLLGYSTVPGYVSFRSSDHGTWYVNALVQIFSAYYTTEDVMQMMVRVNGQVTDAYSLQGYKQCPAPVFTLAKSIYF